MGFAANVVKGFIGPMNASLKLINMAILLVTHIRKLLSVPQSLGPRINAGDAINHASCSSSNSFVSQQPLEMTTTTGKAKPLMVSDLRSATSRRAAADLPLAENILLSPGCSIYKLRTNVFGPLSKGTFGLILGSNSAALRGLTIIP